MELRPFTIFVVKRINIAVAICLGLILGCQEYGLTIDTIIPKGYDREDFTLTISVYGPGDSAEISSCKDFEFGDNQVNRISSSLISSTTIGPESSSSDIPRTGLKLIIIEGYTQDGELGLFGCQEINEIGSNDRAIVVLRPVILLTIEDVPGIEAISNWTDGSVATSATAEFLVSATDVFGDPSPSPVRVIIKGGDGEWSREYYQIEGEAKLPLSMDRLGPFIAHFMPRWSAPTKTNSSKPGFARPGQTVAVPFEADRNVRWVHPLRFGPRGMAYAGLITPDTGQSSLEFAFPSPVEDTPMPNFTTIVPTGIPPGNLTPLGTMFSPNGDENLGDTIVFLNQSQSGNILVATPEAVIDTISGMSVTGLGRTLSELKVVALGHLGDCEQDIEAGPVFLSLQQSNQNGGTAAEFDFGLYSEETGPRFVAPPAETELGELLVRVFLGTVCVADETSALRRIVIFRASDNGISFVDLGSGLSAETSDADLQALLYGPLQKHAALPETFSQTQLDSASQLLTGRSIGFQFQVQQSSYVQPPMESTSPFPTPVTMYTTSGTAALSRSDYLTDIDRPHHLHLLGVTLQEQQSANPAFLLFAQSQSIQDPLYQGGMHIDACRPVTACKLILADIDNNGLSEIYFGNTVGPTSFNENPTLAEIVRLDWLTGP
jgi:hypothetical protein